MKISEDEREYIESDPREFVNLINDVVGDHSSGTVKCLASMLLNDLCERCDGFLIFAVNFAIDSIDRALVDHEPSNLSITADSAEDMMSAVQKPENLFSDPSLVSILTNFKLQFNSVSDFIEVNLVVLTEIAYAIS